MVSLWFPNQVVDDLYEVRDLITSGNMGRVYQVRHRQWGIDLAVKVPKTGIVHSPEIRRQFEDEAQAWVDLGLHPHVVNCVYVRRLDDLPHVFAEWMDGGDLAKGIEDQRIYEQGIAGLLDIAIQCAWGLAHAHDHGLVHQDVKPGNIMLSGDGSVKITDFGIARAYEAAGQGNSGRTGRFAWAGKTVTYRGMTPAYCSPQQAQAAKRNKDKIRLTTATDVWSWGLTVLAMFAGGQPSNHGEKAAEALETVRSRPAGQRIPPLPEELADLLSRCFAHDPTRRPEKMLDLADELTVLFESLTGESYVRRPRLGCSPTNCRTGPCP